MIYVVERTKTYVADVDAAGRLRIEKATAVPGGENRVESEQRVVEGSLQRVAQRVDDGAHETVAAGNVPDFLDAETVGALLALQVKAAGNILGERTQDAFSKNGELAAKSVATLEALPSACRFCRRLCLL